MLIIPKLFYTVLNEKFQQLTKILVQIPLLQLIALVWKLCYRLKLWNKKLTIFKGIKVFNYFLQKLKLTDLLLTEWKKYNQLLRYC